MRHLLIVALVSLAACDSEESQAPTPNPFQEVVEKGITRYFDVADPAKESTEDGVTTYTFDVADGPKCLRGTPYHVAVRDTGSDELFIFLQGGGACWSDFCFAIEEAGKPGIPELDVLDPEDSRNPVRGWSTIFLPYCDGSLFAGDAEYDDDEDGEIDRHHAGLRNLSAALDVAAERFPEPSRVLLAGSSGGGYGTVLATLLVRSKYPEAELMVFNDSGVGIAKAEDPDFVKGLVEEFATLQYVPESCTDCFGNGHLTRLIEWGLERDENLRVAAFSSYGDTIIANLFLKLADADFKAALVSETERLAKRFPGRYAAFLVEGKMHTTLIGDVSAIVGEALAESVGSAVMLGGLDTAVDGLTIAKWMARFIDGDPKWQAVAQ